MVILKALLDNPEKVDRNLVPAIGWVEATRGNVQIDKNNAPMAWVEASKRSISTAIFVSAGGLSVVEQGEIANWIEVNICHGDRKLRERWLTKVPNAHANTLYLADRLQASGNTNTDETYWRRKAWNVLLTAKETDANVVDVDREAVVLLEEVMLEDSKRAGVAGSQQWGLDAGDHQECWPVYVGLPQSWRPGDREGSENEYEVRLFSHPPVNGLLIHHSAWSSLYYRSKTSEGAEEAWKAIPKTAYKIAWWFWEYRMSKVYYQVIYAFISHIKLLVSYLP